MDQQPPKAAKKHRKGVITSILAILLIGALGGCGFLYWQYTKATDKNPQVQQQRWAAELRKVAFVPNETPVITTVLDKTKLTNKSLATHATNGDRLYIFSKAKRIMLYRPSTHQVVDMLTIQGK